MRGIREARDYTARQCQLTYTTDNSKMTLDEAKLATQRTCILRAVSAHQIGRHAR